jgi:hypothetical protein
LVTLNRRAGGRRSPAVRDGDEEVLDADIFVLQALGFGIMTSSIRTTSGVVQIWTTSPSFASFEDWLTRWRRRLRPTFRRCRPAGESSQADERGEHVRHARLAALRRTPGGGEHLLACR